MQCEFSCFLDSLSCFPPAPTSDAQAADLKRFNERDRSYCETVSWYFYPKYQLATPINEYNRALTVEWLCELPDDVEELCPMFCQSVVRLFDAVCCRVKVDKTRFQAVAAACISLAYKYYYDDELMDDQITDWLVQLCADTYTRQQLVDMEWEVFGVSDGFVRYPTPEEYLRLVYDDKNDCFVRIASRYVPALLAHPQCHRFTTAQLATAAAYAAGAKCPTLTTELKNFAIDALTKIPKELFRLRCMTPAMLIADKY